ncbi:hypothetical protein ACHAWF_000347, partial [Thalassiosira exigua]
SPRARGDDRAEGEEGTEWVAAQGRRGRAEEGDGSVTSRPRRSREADRVRMRRAERAGWRGRGRPRGERARRRADPIGGARSDGPGARVGANRQTFGRGRGLRPCVSV